MSSPTKILVVEDDLAILEGIQDILELAGCEVITATNGLEALAVMHSQSPDLVISDIMMPQMDGLEFCRRVRQNPQWATLPFIFLTAKGQKEDIRHGMRIGADDYLTKPFDMDDLLDAVKARLQRAEGIKAGTAEQLAKLRDDILRTLGHELRTPLTFVKGYTELLMESAPEITAEELKTFLKALKAGSDRLNALVEDLIFLISLETGEIKAAYEYERKPLDLVPLVREALISFQEAAASRNVILVDRLPARLPLCIGHRRFLLDAFRRVIDNAIKFTKKRGGRVATSSDLLANEIRIHVQDNGIGIPESELDHIFEKFYQVGRDEQEQQGAGIGLAIVKGIMQIHGGRVEVKSKVGQGSTFTLVFPLAETL